MMRRKSFHLLILFVLQSLRAVCAPEERTFWITFVSGFHETKHVLRIDEFGNTVQHQERLIGLGAGPFVDVRNFPKATAMSHNGPKKLNVWVYTAQHKIARAIVDKQTLGVDSIRFTGLISSNPVHLSVASRPDLSFLSFSRMIDSTDFLFAQKIGPRGDVLQGSWRLSEQSVDGNPEFFFHSYGGATSADGRMAVLMEHSKSKNRIFVQPLNENAKPKGKAVLIDTVNFPAVSDILSADVSNAIDGKHRALVYAVDYSSQNNSSAPKKTFIQMINTQTGEKIGNRILISKIPTGRSQALAIDPSGRFVIISGGGLHYQALDATGQPSGASKIIVKGSASGGIDILEEP